MRWIKHLTRARNDAKVTALLEECGPTGYGVYWMINEIIAEQLDPGGSPSIAHSLSEWSRRLYMHHHRVSSVLGKLEVTGLINLEYAGGKIRVTVPKLLKYRDEYSKKSGHAPDNVSTISKENRSDQIRSDKKHVSPDGDVGGSVCTPVPSTGSPADPDDGMPPEVRVNPNQPLNGHSRCPAGTVSADPYEEWFERVFWPVWPRHKCKAEAKKAGKRKMTTDARREQAMEHLRAELPELLSRLPEKRPHAATWFNQDRWDDPIEDDPLPLLAISDLQPRLTKADARNALMRQRILEDLREQTEQ